MVVLILAGAGTFLLLCALKAVIRVSNFMCTLCVGGNLVGFKKVRITQV
jgi:hypothetical protein